MQLAPNDAYTSNVSARRSSPGGRSCSFPSGSRRRSWSSARARSRMAPAAVLPLTVVGLTVLSLWRRSVGPTKGAAGPTPFRAARLALFHAWRLVPGVAFLMLYAHGWLPSGVRGPRRRRRHRRRADRAARGVGGRAQRTRARRLSYLAWNALGFLDLANVVRAARCTRSPTPPRCTCCACCRWACCRVRGSAHVRGARPGVAPLHGRRSSCTR